MSFIAEISSISLTLAFFAVQCSIVGFAVSGLLTLWQNGDVQEDNAYLKWFFAISLGLLVNIAALFALGMAALLNKYTVLGTGILLALISLPRFLRAIREDRILAHPDSRTSITPILE